ncbi:hypothetical protein BpHYR1_014238 [Brachionus plicatilis]|uniref:Uncharacterized protein n=1 Tax=Brachionus plicatilis TaxID=10195 RepID=A0A3M7SC55_BRAPC|nr:hypothetical protein BpHYR1_014238 [Brachionus plicatilis]
MNISMIKRCLDAQNFICTRSFINAKKYLVLQVPEIQNLKHNIFYILFNRISSSADLTKSFISLTDSTTAEVVLEQSVLYSIAL